MTPAERARFVSLQEAARRCGVSERTIRRWIAHGTLAGYRLGPRLIRLDPVQLDALLRPVPTGTQTARSRRNVQPHDCETENVWLEAIERGQTDYDYGSISLADAVAAYRRGNLREAEAT